MKHAPDVDVVPLFNVEDDVGVLLTRIMRRM
jgi:hypothetical protein